MFNELYLFFQNHINGIVYIMLFFIILLFAFSALKPNANLSDSFIENYGKNILFATFSIIILLFIFSLFGYNFSFTSTTSTGPSTNPLLIYFKENSISILNMVLLFLFLISFFAIMGVNFNTPQNKRIRKVVEIEGFTCNSDQVANEIQCNALSQDNCIATGCCGLLNGTKCVSSDAYNKNPNFYSDASGNSIKVQSWCNNNSCDSPLTDT
jgi:hypothetical protein